MRGCHLAYEAQPVAVLSKLDVQRGVLAREQVFGKSSSSEEPRSIVDNVATREIADVARAMPGQPRAELQHVHHPRHPRSWLARERSASTHSACLSELADEDVEPSRSDDAVRVDERYPSGSSSAGADVSLDARQAPLWSDVKLDIRVGLNDLVRDALRTTVHDDNPVAERCQLHFDCFEAAVQRGTRRVARDYDGKVELVCIQRHHLLDRAVAPCL